jgi:flagellar protein FliO/FliZ
MPLGTDNFAAVISVGKKAWLVGGGSGAGLSLIAEIDEQEALETMLLDEAQKNAETGTGRILDFRAMLNRLGANNTRTELGSHVDSLKKKRERLRGL